MTKLIAKFIKELNTGLGLSQHYREGVFWTQGQNVVFEDGIIKAALGQYGMFGSGITEPILGIQSIRQNNINTIYYGSRSKLMKWTESAGITDLTNSSGYTGTDADLWQFARWGSWIVASNGVDPLQVDKNDGNGFVNLTTPFDWAKVIYATDTHLIAMNTSEGEANISWSDIDDITEWVASSTNEAGTLPQRNQASGIIAAAPLGDGSIGIYTTNELLSMNYIRAPFVFGVNDLVQGFGLTSKYGVTVVNRLHYGMGRKNIWATDGSTYKAIDSPAVQEFVYRDSPYKLNADYAHLIVTWHDALQEAVIFSYPHGTNTYNSVSLVYHYNSGLWSLFDYGRSSADDSNIFNSNITGDRRGNIYAQSSSLASPAAGDAGTLETTNESASVQTGYGGTGYGQLGYGGNTNGTI